MDKRKAVVEGPKVHDVGYRFFAMEGAVAHGIEKFRAVNRVGEAQEVHVYFEGEEEGVESYSGFLRREAPEDAEVSDVAFEEFEGTVPPIDLFALVFNAGLYEEVLRRNTGEMREGTKRRPDRVAERL